MAQTTAAISWKDCYVALSSDGTTWTDISGHSNSVEMSGGERAVGEAYTADGDTALITSGKRAPITVTFNCIYTETGNEAYSLAKAAYEGATALYGRWSPKGGAVGEYQFTTGAGTVTQPPYPVGSSDSGDPLAVAVVMTVPSVAQATVA